LREIFRIRNKFGARLSARSADPIRCILCRYTTHDHRATIKKSLHKLRPSNIFQV